MVFCRSAVWETGASGTLMSSEVQSLSATKRSPCAQKTCSIGKLIPDGNPNCAMKAARIASVTAAPDRIRRRKATDLRDRNPRRLRLLPPMAAVFARTLQPSCLLVLVAIAVLVTRAQAQLERLSATKPVFKAGFAQRDITPDIGMEMPGNYGKVYGRGVHDPCKVRAAVFDDGAKRVALVGIDALMIRRETAPAARKAIQDRCGIPPEHVMIGASHSHSSGPTGMILPGEFDHASPSVQQLAYEKSSTANLTYLKRVEAAIVDAVCAANEARAEARCSFGSGHEDKASFNRRLRMNNGMTWSHPGRGNPDIVSYAGPIDPEVGIIGAWDKTNRLLGVIVNFACHATTSPPGFSANWIYYLERTIRGGLGAEVPVVFLQGDCGDITQVDNLDPHDPPSGERHAQIVGGSIGAEAVKVLLRAEPGNAGPVDARTKIWKIKRRVPDPNRVKKSLELVQKPEKEVDRTEWIFAKEIVLLNALI